ncbi:MAG TPA: glycosyltransferase [Blastocatellia bacterium]|nr:glycosyltransferase [Blastocatellia bacterium]
MKQRVLQLVSSFNQGGSERQAVQLARLLKESDRYDVRMACLDLSGVLLNEAQRLEIGEIPEYKLTSFYDRKMVTELRRFAAFLRSEGIDVLHTHDFYTNVFGMMAGAIARVPVRVASRRETTGWRTQKQKLVERMAYRLAHRVVANAGAVRDQLVKEGVSSEKIVTVYNGLDMARIKPTADLKRDETLASFGLPCGDEFQFVTIVANLRHPVKDHPTFFRAAALVRAARPCARFIIAGEGELTDSMRALAKELGLERETFFIGRVERVAELLAVSDVCVLSSKAEGFSNSILEYMAAARPVVVTDVGGAREAAIDQESGFIVPPCDPPAMASRIVELLSQPELARAMGERGRERVEQEFSCRAQLERTENLYKVMLEDSPPRRSEHKMADDAPSARGGAEKNSSPLRVLIVAPSLDILGGQAVQAARLLARLREEATVEVSFLPVNPRLPGVLRRLQSFKYVRTVVTSLFYWAQLLARVRKYDVIHAFSASYTSFVLAPTPAIVVAKLYRKKVILNYRSGEAEDHLRRWRRTAIPTIRLVDRIAVPSGYLVDIFRKFGLSAQSIFNFVETDKFKFRNRSPLRPVFLSNRNLEPMYNVACVLRAFAIIQSRVPDARLIVAGDGSQQGALKQLASELRLRGVEFVGRTAPEKIERLYDEADIYLNSPDIDNMPGSILEAFASGLPVVTTDAGGIPYIVTDRVTGMMVERNDHVAMAERALMLLNDQVLALEIASRAREECKKYEWGAVKGRWISLYYETAGRQSHEIAGIVSASATTN